MISYIKGTVAYKDAEGAVIETGGIGYELSMSVHALSMLPNIGDAAHVWTYLQVKDDGVSLFGFSSPEEKELFTRLISVNGVGPRMALSALSTFKPQELVSAVAAGDIASLSTIPSVGKKTAQRIVLDLQGKLEAQSPVAGFGDDAASRNAREASSALESMGFTSIEIAEALKGCTATSTEDMILHALKNVGGSK